MKGLFVRKTFSAILLCLISIPVLSCLACAEERLPEGVAVNAPNGISANIYSKPDTGSDVITIVLQGNSIEVLGRAGKFLKVRVPATRDAGYVLEAETVPTRLVEDTGRSWLMIIGLCVLVAALVAVPAIFFLRAKETKEVQERSIGISESIRKAEELFRAGEYAEAIKQFNRHVELQGGTVRNPDVYRRLAVCYQKTDQFREAAQCWTKMRDLNGLKGLEDHVLGVELMTALGKEGEAANIYEKLLDGDIDEDTEHDIRKKLVGIYRHLKDAKRLLKHVDKLLQSQTPDTGILPPTVQFLISEGETDEAIEIGNKAIIAAVCEELLEEEASTPSAERIYLKCLEYDRTDKRIHRILAKKYKKDGDYRRAVSLLTVLTQLDKRSADDYTQEAAELYMESGRIADALAEGNPKIIRKMAQMYLMRSEVHPNAVAIYEKVLETQPHAVGINKILSTVYLTRGDKDKYMEKLRLLHQVDGENYDYLKDLAQCMIDNELVDEALREGNRDLIGRILMQLVKREAHDDKSVNLFELLIKREPDNPKLRKALATAYDHRGESDKALQHLLALTRLQPDDTASASKAAEIATQQNLVGRVLNEGTDKVIVLTARELIRANVEGPECRQLLEKALRASPGQTEIKDYLARLGGLSELRAPNREPARPTEITFETFEGSFSPAPESKGPEVAVGRVKRDAAETARDRQETGEALSAKEAASKPLPKRKVAAGEHPVTTFVSSADRGPRIEYHDDQLFRPETGGTAYKSLEILRTDGWGSWHLAVEVNTGQHVLMRCFKQRLLPGDQMKLFIDEVAEVAFNMVHENVLSPEEQVIGPDRTNGNTYAYLPLTLEQVMYKDRRPDLATRLGLIRGIVKGLCYAHSYVGVDGKLRRTYHLQFQPSVVLFSEDMSVSKIANFGQVQAFRNRILAREPRYKDPGMNHAYMPPEFFRLRASTIQERLADVYALGTVMYYLVAGHPPFEGPAFEDFKFQHTKVAATPPRMVDPSVPGWLDELIMKAMEKQPEARWQSANEILDRLNREMGRAQFQKL